MIPTKLLEAVQRRAVLRRLVQDARVTYGPIDSTPPRQLIECGEIVPVNHNVVPVAIVHEVVNLLEQLIDFESAKVEKFAVVEREPIKIPHIEPKEQKDDAGEPAANREPTDSPEKGGAAPGRKKPLRGGKAH
jgi:hypothetical protein